MFPQPADDLAGVVRQLGERVRVLRKRRGMTQIQLAEATGMDRRTLQQLEYGRATRPERQGDAGNPQLDTIWKLSIALEVELSDLFALDTEDETQSS